MFLAIIHVASDSSYDISFIDPLNERNKKDKLYNALIHFFESHNCFLSNKTEADVNGKKLILNLRDLFWHIDGHHHVLSQRSLPIPDCFTTFQNYNRPELSKHRNQ